MADDELIDDDVIVGDDDLDEDEVFDEDDIEDADDLVGDDLEVVGVVVGDTIVAIEDEDDDEPDLAPARKAEDDEEDDDDADPDDVEEDLDTILRDRIKAGEDDDEEDEEQAAADDRSEAGERVAPRAAEELPCPECFLLVRSSQFSTKRTDCPGGLDGDDCPMKPQFT